MEDGVSCHFVDPGADRSGYVVYCMTPLRGNGLIRQRGTIMLCQMSHVCARVPFRLLEANNYPFFFPLTVVKLIDFTAHTSFKLVVSPSELRRNSFSSFR